jgi:hypothetical protein
MKIYEVSQAKKSRINEDIVDEASLGSMASAAKSFASGVKGAWDAGSLGNFKDSKRQAQIQQIADKSYNVWKEFVRRYAASITDPEDKKDYLNHTSNLYRNQLYAFVQKNFLGNRPLKSLDNGDHIAKIINKLSAPVTNKPPSSKSTDDTSNTADQPAQKQLKLGQTRTPPTPEEIRASKQQYQQELDKQKAQAAAAREKYAQDSEDDTGRATQPLIRHKANEDIISEEDESNEKKLFTELITAASMSQKMADIPDRRSGRRQNTHQDIDSEHLIRDLSQAGITNTALRNLGDKTIEASGGSNKARPTGNPGADELLKLMGFKLG